MRARLLISTILLSLFTTASIAKDVSGNFDRHDRVDLEEIIDLEVSPMRSDGTYLRALLLQHEIYNHLIIERIRPAPGESYELSAVVSRFSFSGADIVKAANGTPSKFWFGGKLIDWKTDSQLLVSHGLDGYEMKINFVKDGKIDVTKK